MAEDIDILLPDRDVQIGDETVTVREYRFKEGLHIAAMSQAFLHDLRDLFMHPDGTPVEQIALDDLTDLFAVHGDTIARMVAQSVDKSVDWLDGLSDEDGLTLMHVWWAVNQPFFTRRLVQTAATRRITTAASDSGTSLPH